MLWIWTKELEDIINSTANKNDTISQHQNEIIELLKEAKLKKALEDAVTANITIDQFEQTSKDVIQKILSKSKKVKTKPSISDITAQNVKLAQALKEFGFAKDDIKKLIATNLINDNIDPKEKKKIESIISSLK